MKGNLKKLELINIRRLLYFYVNSTLTTDCDKENNQEIDFSDVSSKRFYNLTNRCCLQGVGYTKMRHGLVFRVQKEYDVYKGTPFRRVQF